MSTPLISIVVPTKNSLPHLKNAINGIRRQTYRNFELIIQDGGSSDGTLDYLSSLTDLPKIDIRSEPDFGIGQAYNRGISRCNGEFLFLAASDECLFSNTLEKLISWFQDAPSAAYIHGGVVLINQQRRELSRFIAPPFDFLKLMHCELYLSTAGLLNRKIIGKDLFYDESLKTCPDYEFRLRMGSRFSPQEIIHREELLMTALCDRTSMSYRAESFEQFCKDKVFILDRFLSSVKPPMHTNLEISAKAGIFLWAAKEVVNLKKGVPYAIKFCQEAENFRKKIDTPPNAASATSIEISLYRNHKLSNWFPSHHFHSVRLKLPASLKGSFLRFPIIAAAMPSQPSQFDEQKQYWIKIRMKIFSGFVEIYFIEKNQAKKEKLFSFNSNEIVTYYPLSHPRDFRVEFYNRGHKRASFEIHELSIIQSNTAPV